MFENEIEKIEKQAYEWLAVMNSEDKTQSEISGFQNWLAADSRHEIVYNEISSIWSDISECQEMSGSIPSMGHGDLNYRQKMLFFGENLIATFLQPRFTVSAFIVLSVAGIFLGLNIYLTPRFELLNESFSTPQTRIRDINLPDGSVVTLGAQSEIAVNYLTTERRVNLIEGEVFFSVEKETDRPFIVTTSSTEIRVHGTKFEVRYSDREVHVSVLEGKVEVIQLYDSNNNGLDSQKRIAEIITSNQKIKTKSGGGFTEIQTMKLEKPGAWRGGRLVYENAKLAEVVSDIDRYYIGNIIIESDKLRDLPISAAFKIDQVDNMLNSLAQALPLQASKLPNGDIKLKGL